MSSAEPGPDPGRLIEALAALATLARPSPNVRAALHAAVFAVHRVFAAPATPGIEGHPGGPFALLAATFVDAADVTHRDDAVAAAVWWYVARLARALGRNDSATFAALETAALRGEFEQYPAALARETREAHGADAIVN